MINPCTLSDRALKILIILWQAATALSTDQIMATYAQKVGKYSIRIALMELDFQYPQSDRSSFNNVR